MHSTAKRVKGVRAGFNSIKDSDVLQKVFYIPMWMSFMAPNPKLYRRVNCSINRCILLLGFSRNSLINNITVLSPRKVRISQNVSRVLQTCISLEADIMHNCSGRTHTVPYGVFTDLSLRAVTCCIWKRSDESRQSFWTPTSLHIYYWFIYSFQVLVSRCYGRKV